MSDKRESKFLSVVIYVAEKLPEAPELKSVELYQGDAVKISWIDKSGKAPPPAHVEKMKKLKPKKRRQHKSEPRETGFRVDRKIGDGEWYTIAFRPPQTKGHPMNPPEWIDFTAPRGKTLLYRVVGLGGHPTVGSASAPSGVIVLE